MSDELLAQYRRGAHIRTRAVADGHGNGYAYYTKAVDQTESAVQTAGGVLCKTIVFSFAEGCRCGGTIRTHGGVAFSE